MAIRAIDVEQGRYASFICFAHFAPARRYSRFIARSAINGDGCLVKDTSVARLWKLHALVLRQNHLESETAL